MGEDFAKWGEDSQNRKISQTGKKILLLNLAVARTGHNTSHSRLCRGRVIVQIKKDVNKKYPHCQVLRMYGYFKVP
jgi:hypothetical protein